MLLLRKDKEDILNCRLDLRDKKRKINRIYNISIAIDVVLIVIVAITIFTGNDMEKTSTEPTKSNQIDANTDRTLKVQMKQSLLKMLKRKKKLPQNLNL